MGLPATAVSIAATLLSVGRIVLGILLIAAPLSLRDGAPWRIPFSLAALVVIYAALAILLFVPSMDGGVGFYSGQLVTFSLLLISTVGFVSFVFDTSVWTALFCCTAGYTIQNLASGATELFWTLAGGPAPMTEGFYTPLRFAISAVCTLVIYGASYLLITRYLMRSGLGRLENRSMVAMMAVVIIVIIGFDLVVKWLTDNGVGTVPMVLLRLFHGLACVFTLAMEFELLVRRRLEAERDTLTQVLAEHERQYEQSRETVAAVNARMHDIRHSIARLADSAHVEKGVLREMMREVNVYDTAVRTGNEALDTVLSEKRLTLGRMGTTLTCVADGSALSFMAPADVYTLFCALLDAAASGNATSVSLVMRKAYGTTSVHIESNGTITSANILSPAEALVHRYGGTFTASRKDGSFHMNALFPAA